MDNLMTLLKERYSVRAYKKDKVEKDKIDRILEAGRVAPTACNKQPVKILVLESEDALSKLKNCCSRDFAPPLAFIICADKSVAWVRKYDGKQSGDIDTSIITDHMMLEATELGLGSLWVCNFKPEEVIKNYDLPENLEPVNLLLVGYSDAEKKSPSRHDEERKSIDEIAIHL